MDEDEKLNSNSENIPSKEGSVASPKKNSVGNGYKAKVAGAVSKNVTNKAAQVASKVGGIKGKVAAKAIEKVGKNAEQNTDENPETNPIGSKIGGLGFGSNNKLNGKTTVQLDIKEIWKKIPFSVKLAILQGLGIFLLIVIVAAAVMGIAEHLKFDFFGFFGEAEAAENIYNDYWEELCDEETCSEEEIKNQTELIEAQKKFFDKLHSLSKEYELTKEQEYTVLATVLYNYDLSNINNGDFEVDDTDQIDFESSSVTDAGTYRKETDQLKELVKQYRISVPYCEIKRTNENGDSITESHPLFDANNKMIKIGNFDKFLMDIGFKPYPEGYNEASSSCTNDEGGRVYIDTTNDYEASKEAYFDYLRDSTYFDDRPAPKEDFERYAKSHNLSNDTATWTEKQRVEVREEIIKNIQDIVDGVLKEENPDGEDFIAVSGSSYWWPIGSTETQEKDGILFATGDPASTTVGSKFGPRPGIGNGFHSGQDIPAPQGTNIIAALGGTVTYVHNGCPTVGYIDNTCGNTYGNHVKIQDAKGNVNVYAHMTLDTITVAVGDKVSQGQVIGKVGSSGSSSGNHLHFGIQINGKSVNPMDYIDPDNPRPYAGTIDFNSTSFTKEEFIAKVNNITSSRSGFNSLKNALNNGGAETVYDVATSMNLNPEIYFIRAVVEGYSPGTNYNFVGYNCTNTGGVSACYSFPTFKDAVTTFYKNISQYDSVESMAARYAYIGAYWYTTRHTSSGNIDWGIGGCPYASSIYPDGIPDRVKNACDHPDDSGYCSPSNTNNCVATTEADQLAYRDWQVQKMVNARNNIFK